ncbi:MAG: hypothetical protein C4B59_12520 [Candidatus Methanogaster sp.]|uniref:Uncharacterized protein n=1 Tax=Candidatus Methanogaster sp. TaxID=3386292 RepID=A0AC61L0A5_9EURY|nr:MAG: hypothetical protein C4B59_12520 [ANME-2 cluster archaeon]
MSEYIVLKINIEIPNGPKITLNRTLTVDAYDKIDITVPSGASDLSVELQPGESAGQVKFLLVASDWYGDALAYKVNSDMGTSFELDEPHVLTGEGATAMLEPAPTQLFFSNTTSGADAMDANIQILVGRDVTS